MPVHMVVIRIAIKIRKYINSKNQSLVSIFKIYAWELKTIFYGLFISLLNQHISYKRAFYKENCGTDYNNYKEKRIAITVYKLTTISCSLSHKNYCGIKKNNPI